MVNETEQTNSRGLEHILNLSVQDARVSQAHLLCLEEACDLVDSLQVVGNIAGSKIEVKRSVGSAVLRLLNEGGAQRCFALSLIAACMTI